MPTATELKREADEFRNAGRGDRAIARYQKAQEIFLDEDDTGGATECMHMLGVALVFEDEEEMGLKALKAALEARNGPGNLVDLGRVQRDLGVAQMIYRHYLRALEYLEQSRVTLLNSNDLAERAITEAKLGRLYSLEGEYGKVDGCFDEAFLLINQVDQPDYLVAMHIDNAFACLEREQIGYMGSHLDTAWSLLEQSGETQVQLRRVAQIMGLRIRLAINMGDWQHARSLYSSRFVPVHEELTPGCRSVLSREIHTEELAKLVQ